MVEVNATTSFLADMEAATSRQGHTSMLVAQAGTFLAHPDRSKTFGEARGTGVDLTSELGAGAARQIVSGEPGIVSVDGLVLAYEPVFPVEGDSDTFWVAVRSVPDSVIRADAVSFRNSSLLIMVFVLLLTVTIATVVVRRLVSTPLRRVAGAARALSQGSTEVRRLELSSNDEVGDMVSTVARQAQIIAEGDLDNDELTRHLPGVMGEAFTTMVSSLTLASSQAEAVASGDLRAEVLKRKIPGAVGEALRTMITFLEGVLGSMSSAVIVTDDAGVITSVGGTTVALTGFAEDILVGSSAFELLLVDARASGRDAITTLRSATGEAELVTAGGVPVPVLLGVSPLTDGDGNVFGAVCAASDISERKQFELERLHAQKLESVGQLAAGIAHEMNTPIQYIGDSVHFLGDILGDMMELHDRYRILRDEATGHEDLAALISEIEQIENDIDITLVHEEAPRAVDRTLEGIERVTTIVKALKQFSHPGGDDHAPEDVNQIIETTLTVARSEYKYVADLHFEPGDIPEVVCDRGDIGQVFLNLIVNAAHAIADRVNGSAELGDITITSSLDGDGVRVDVFDTGGGIPSHIRGRVFDPFFTTKEPGKGTGQGLAIVHSIVVDRHQGRISFDV
ncbi:MAG: ATP-binding protein, partial [Acidimicrobiales bacterium]